MTQDTSTVEQARELLAAELDEAGDALNANKVRHGSYVCEEIDIGLRAIAKALAKPVASPDAMKLIEQLREDAQQRSAASKMLADAKSDRQTDKNDYPDMPKRGYSYVLPEQTVSWKAAEMLAALSSPRPVDEVREAINYEELSVKHGQQVSVTFKNSADAFALFNEIKGRQALASLEGVSDGQ